MAKSKSNGRIASWRMNLEKFPLTIVLVRAIADNRVAVARGIGLYCTILDCIVLYWIERSMYFFLSFMHASTELNPQNVLFFHRSMKFSTMTTTSTSSWSTVEGGPF